MPPVRKRPKLEQLTVSQSQDSTATAWHEIEDVSRQVLSQRILGTADLLRCEMVCKHWRKLQLPLSGPIDFTIKQQSHVSWLQHNISRINSLSIDIADDRVKKQEFEAFGAHDTAVGQSNTRSLQQLDHNAIAGLLGEARLATCLVIYSLHVPKLPEGLTALTGLQQLTIHGMPALSEVSFDTVAALASLTSLRLVKCRSLQQLGDGISKLTQLKCLECLEAGWGNGRKAVNISSKVGDLTGLQHLKLVNTNIPHTLVNITSLQTLIISHPVTAFSNLQKLSQLQCLSKLLLDSHREHSLPPDLGDLQALVHLILSCQDNPALDPVTRLRRLQHLEIWDCSSLSSLPNDLGVLSGLTHLTVNGDRFRFPDDRISTSATGTSQAGILEIPDSLGALTKLQRLVLQHCEHLDWLPDAIGGLHELVSLVLKDCGALEYIPSEIGCLTTLESVELVYCMRLGELPDSFSKLAALTHIVIDRCGIQELPELVLLNKLECMTLNCCRQLQSLPASVGHLCSLKSLNIAGCSVLTSLPDELGQLSGLRLCLKDCPGLKVLPASVSELHPEVVGCHGLMPCVFKDQPTFFLW